MSEWQPIETAPKDGTPVLLYGGRVFCESREKYVYHQMAASWFKDRHRECWLVAGCEGGYVAVNVDGPTHWQLLPPPPVPA